jgi:Flp pilus assembly protein TadB
MTDTEGNELRVDVGVLKSQVSTLTSLCGKMDTVIDKLIEQHDRHIAKVYIDMEERRKETDADIKEIHGRIDTVIDKLQLSELRIMDELKDLRKEMKDHNDKEKAALDALLEWKWMIAGGILVLSWLISHIHYDTIEHLLK